MNIQIIPLILLFFMPYSYAMDTNTVILELINNNSGKSTEKISLLKKYANLSHTLKNTTETTEESIIPITHINKKTIKLIIEIYLPEISRGISKHKDSLIAEGIRTHIKSLLAELSLPDLYNVMNAADYLDISELLNLSCKVWIKKSIKPISLARLHEKNNPFTSYILVPTIYSCIQNHLNPTISSYLYRHHIATRESINDTIILNLTNDSTENDIHECFTSVDLNNDNSQIAAGSNQGIIYIQPIAKMHELLIFLGHQDAITSICFSPRNKELLASSSMDCTIKLWDLKKKCILCTLEGHTRPISTICFNPSGTHIVSTGKDEHIVCVWNVTTKKCIQILSTKNFPWRVQFLDNKTFGCATCCNTIYIFEWNNELEIYQKTNTLTHETFGEFGFNPQKNIFATDTAEGTISLIDVKTKSTLHRLKKHTNTIYGLRFNHAGNLLASASDDGTICIWDLSTKKCIQTLDHKKEIKSIQFSANDTQLVSASYDGTVRIWQLIAPIYKLALDSIMHGEYSCNQVSNTMSEKISFDQLRLLIYASVRTQENASLNFHGYPYLHKLFMAFDPVVKQFLLNTLNIRLAKY